MEAVDQSNTTQAPEPIVVTQAEIAATFAEWDRRYREEPEKFMTECQHLLRETPESFGEQCRATFIKVLADVRAPKEQTSNGFENQGTSNTSDGSKAGGANEAMPQPQAGTFEG